LRGLVPFRFSTRQHWREEDARAVLDRLESSGLSVRQFAARERLSAVRLYRWRARLAGFSKAPAFVEIRPTVIPTIEVVLPTGHVVRVPNGFDEETLRRLTAILDGSSARC
jgi:hypothetical protein